MGTFGDIWGPQGRPTAPPGPHWATCGAPYGLPEASAVQHFKHCHKDALGHEGICERPLVAHSGTAGCTPPGPPRGHLGTHKTPRTPKKTHRAMWGAPYRLPNVMVDLHLKDPIGTLGDPRAPPGGSQWNCRWSTAPPGPPWGHLGTPKTPRTPPKHHGAMWGAPYGLTEVRLHKDPIGTHWDTKRPASAPWWLTVELQVECSPPGPPWGHLGTSKTLRTPQKNPPTPPPQKNPQGDMGRPLSAPRGNGGWAPGRPHRDTLGH